MCTPTIIDSDSVDLVVPRSTATEKSDPIFEKWILTGYGVLCYTGVGKLGQELDRTRRFKQKLQTYKERGRARLIPKDKMENAKKALEEERLRSNDLDLLALVLASNAEIVVTNDGDLIRDIKEYIRREKRATVAIYPRLGKRRRRQKFLDQRRCICR